MEPENDMPGAAMEGEGDLVDAIGEEVEAIIGMIGEERTLSILQQISQRLGEQPAPAAEAGPPARPASPFEGADPMTRALMG